MARRMMGYVARGLRRSLAAEQGGLCIYCRVPMTEHLGGVNLLPTDATLEHLIPVSRGGSNATSNLAVSCYDCNKTRKNMPHETFLQSKRKDLTDEADQDCAARH